MENFWNGFIKAAGENPEGHHVRRFFLGNPVSAVIEAEKGKKLKAFGDALGHSLISMAGGASAGALGGAGLGAAMALRKGRVPLSTVGNAMRQGASHGMAAGTILGSLRGQHGREASEIHGRYSKHKADS